MAFKNDWIFFVYSSLEFFYYCNCFPGFENSLAKKAVYSVHYMVDFELLSSGKGASIWICRLISFTPPDDSWQKSGVDN